MEWKSIFSYTNSSHGKLNWNGHPVSKTSSLIKNNNFAMASTNKTDFASDPRMKLNEQTGKWSYVGEEGVSYEYDENVGAWFPMVNFNYKKPYNDI